MRRFPFILIVLTALVFGSCSTEKAEEIADEFHQKLDEKDFDYIVNNLVDLQGDATEDDWYGFLDLVDSWGPQLNRTKEIGFNKKINNGITSVKLSYTFELEELGLVYERLVLVDRGDGEYKIFTATMNSDESIVEAETADY